MKEIISPVILKDKFQRIFTIPDIHGEYQKLKNLLDYLMLNLSFGKDGDLLIFLGDMIDRGPNSNQVVSIIISLIKKFPGKVYALRGNHEDFALEAFSDFRTRLNWLRPCNGGSETLDSYENKMISTEHLDFFRSLPYSIETEDFFFSHAPVPRENKRTGQSKNFGMDRFGVRGEGYNTFELTWHYFGPECERKGAYMDVHEGPRALSGTGNKNLIGHCGHIHRGEDIREIRKFKNYIMLDTGCGCFESSPLALYECFSGEVKYFN